MLGETKNQFSLTRAVLSTGGHAKSNFLSVISFNKGMKSLSVLFSVIVIVAFLCAACSAGKKASSVEGQVVDAQGKPLGGIEILATQQEPLKGYEKCEVKTKSDGKFVIEGLYPQGKYIITPVADNYNKRGTTIEIISGPPGETKLLKDNMVLKFSPFKKSNDGVIKDTRSGLEWMPAAKAMNYPEATQFAQTLAASGGGWRLPAVAELKSLYNPEYREETGGGLDPLFNLNLRAEAWSSQIWGNAPNNHPFSVEFFGGSENGYNQFEDHKAVLAVRSKQ
jgi:hypothetical protein